MSISIKVNFKVNGEDIEITNDVSAKELAFGLEVVLEYKWMHFLLAWKEDRYCVVKTKNSNIGLVILTNDLEIEEIRIFEEDKHPTLKKRVLLTLLVAKKKGDLDNFISVKTAMKRPETESYTRIQKWI